MNPPIIVVHGNALSSIPESYTRYLEHTFRKAFKLQGTPLRVQYKTSDNPYDAKASAARAEKPGGKVMPRHALRGTNPNGNGRVVKGVIKGVVKTKSSGKK